MILVLGSGGQVGRALLAELGNAAQGVDYPDVDFTKPQSVIQRVRSLRPEAILNAAAYTAVDQAEKEEPIAHAINAETPGALAALARELKIPFVHFSTDYVYSGEGSTPRSESEPPAPLNAYGRTKLEGDRRVLESGGSFLILRTCWVYDGQGKNFLNTMLRLGSEREELSVVSDQIGAPTYAFHLARAALKALEVARALPEFPSGLYHLTASGETSWYGFAEAIFEHARRMGLPLKLRTLRAIPSSQYPVPARRPLNSRLSNLLIAERLGVRMPSWQEGLESCLRERPQLRERVRS
jgi:dTDP-4-dehydrorhamnose reductase